MMKQGVEVWIVIPEPLPIYQRLMPKLRTPLRARKYPLAGQLNPTWVEWLMGFPIGWTELNVSETP